MRFLRSIIFSICLVGCIPLNAVGQVTRLELTFPQTNGFSMHGFAEISSDVVVAVGLASTILRSEDGGLSWNQIVAPTMTAPDLYDVEVLDNGTLVAAGQEPGVFTSIDGGFHWSSPGVPAVATFRDVCLLPNGSVSVAGDDGIILVSNDHGLTWQNVGPGDGPISHHLWRTNQECIVTNDSGILHTTDNGLSWNVVKPGFSFGFDEVFQASDSHLVVYQGFQRFDSFDGGTSWAGSEIVGPPYPFRTVVIDSLHWILAEFSEGAELHETFNGGETWDYLNYHNAMGYTSLKSLSNGRLLASSTDGLIRWSDNLFTTVNSGWESILLDNPNLSINHLVARDDGVLFAHGANHLSPSTTSYLRSDDEGDTWDVLSGGPGIALNELVFWGNDQALASNNQEIHYSNDGGLTWAQSNIDQSFTIVDLAIASEDRFFATTNLTVGGNLITSTDGGGTWSVVESGLPLDDLRFAQVEFISSQEGWVNGLVSNVNTMFHTNDGGQTWENISSFGLSGKPSSMLWLDSNTGYLGVRSGGSAVAGVYRTDNAGLNWMRLSTNRTEAIYSGFENEILTLGPYLHESTWSTDAGLTWDPIFNPFRAPFNVSDIGPKAVLFLGGSWLMSGVDGKIFKLTVNELSAVNDLEVPISRERLISASPNPFNPSTVISLTIKENSGPLTLDVFNVRGALIRRLWHGLPDAGQLEVHWDGLDQQGNAAPSGVYFAKLNSEKYQATGKLMLIK